ncbi:MAG: hypothetical protein M9894_07460 [Planctomycetes bacterium]|nr:hypothetical protein [Planctomycetota bacterium]
MLFCRIAVRSALLTQTQADEALLAVEAPGGVAALCVARGWLTSDQARALTGSAGATAEVAPTVAGEEARQFARLVTMKRLAADGQVEACRALQRELAGGAYERLGLLLIQKAQRRGGAPTPGIASRQEAFDHYVRMKQAVQRGALEEVRRLAEALRDHPEFGRMAQMQLNRALTRHSLGLRGRAQDCHPCGDTSQGFTPPDATDRGAHDTPRSNEGGLQDHPSE